MDREMRMAVIVASARWTGTSIVEGALAVLQQVYGRHEFVGSQPSCARCGKPKSDHNR